MEAQTMIDKVRAKVAARQPLDPAVVPGFGVTAMCLDDAESGEVAIQVIEITQSGSLQVVYPEVPVVAGVILEVSVSNVYTQVPFGSTLYFMTGSDTLTVATSPGTQCQFYFWFTPDD